MTCFPPHVVAQLDPAIDELAGAMSALHAALGNLAGAARADLDPDNAETAFLASAAAAARNAFGSESDSAEAMGHISGLCADVAGFLGQREL
ncbi:hypothetical protein [Candidatus Poriferisocius sp.]|uniref:hypothetical protein n=1 Tax=Candidatus Poriferisocius sp. TaxID=3101276 RepID=UPI003B0141B4